MTAEVLTERSAPALVAAIEANMVKHFVTFGRVPGATLHDGPDMTWVAAGVPHLMLNGVFRTRLAPDGLGARIDETLRVFTSRRLPFRWVLGPSTRPADLGTRLSARGIGYARDWIGMAADLSALNWPAASPPGLVVEEARDARGLTKWVVAFCRDSHVPEAVARVFFESFAGAGLGRDRPMRHYLGCLDGEPVATTTLCFAAGVAGIYWVYTAPPARRRGIAAALVLAALRDAVNAGYRFGILHSTQMGEGVYRQIGFEELCRLPIHVWPGEAKHGGEP